jgi:3-hydroxyacyl-CoA dehydrogenase
MIELRIVSGVAVITVDNPPVNALGRQVRSGLLDAIRRAELDPEARAIVITCAGRTFFAGADINEFGKPLQLPSLPEVIASIEKVSKPVVAAMHGSALGGGLELALGCHYRMASPFAKLGLPEVKLGLLPGAGGTQRLPRVIGVADALAMIVEGDSISAPKAAQIGLVDRLSASDETLEQEALAFAREVAHLTAHPIASLREDKLAEAACDPDIFSRYRAAKARRLAGLDAPEACIRAIQAAVELPVADGLKLERELFVRLVAGDQSKAQRHIFFAERAAARIDDLAADTPVQSVATVGILGAGTMGGGIAMNFLSAGLPVTLVEREPAALERGVAAIRRAYESSAERGRLSSGQVEQAMALLTSSLSFDDLAGCDLIVEAVFELMEVKRDVFRKLDAIAKEGAVLASNTSYLDLDAIGAVTSRPGQVVGMHFFSPANVMRLLEVVRGRATAPTVLKTVMSLARRIGKTAVVAGVCHGFIGNRMLAPRQREAMKLVVEGATPWQVDQVLLDFGMPMGPFQMTDLAGLDLGWTRETSTGATLKEVLCEADRRGQKNGRGFYDYDENRNRTASPEVERMIARFRSAHGVKPRSVDAREVRERLLYPMVNEGALILEEGIAQRASDIDVVWTSGYGWPVHTGGPMFWADAIGVDTVLAGLEFWREALGPDLRISDLLRRKARKAECFNG